MFKYNYHSVNKSRLSKMPTFYVTISFFTGVPGCGGLLTAPNGQFSSPQHPETYANHLDCEWLIRVPQGDRIELNFLAFDVEEHRTCL